MEDNSETTPGRLMEKYNPANGERRKVRIDPTINYGHLISAGVSLVSALIFVITAWTLLDKRVLVLENDKTYQAARDVAQDAAVKDKFDDLKNAIQEMKLSINELRRDVREKK